MTLLIAGLTGNVGAGKSTVAELWRRAGVPVASADEFARTAVAPGTATLDRVAELFGPEALGPDGAMDRAAVRRIVFGDPEARRRLEAVVHPEVKRLRDEWTAAQRAAGVRLAAWEVPLLFETGMEREVDVVVLVDAPVSLRRRRIMEARGATEAEADAVIAAQRPAEEKRARAEWIVENGGTRAELAAQAAQVLEELRRRATDVQRRVGEL